MSNDDAQYQNTHNAQQHQQQAINQQNFQQSQPQQNYQNQSQQQPNTDAEDFWNKPENQPRSQN